jgi:FkbM family methyltransferase
MKRHNIKNGKYVDVGAFHPIKYSNTCLLFNKGWSGINIDLNPTSIDYFKILRPKDKNVCCAISNKEKKTRIFINNIFSPLNTISRKHAASLNFDSKNELQFFTKSRKFNNIVKKKFNFLNIDIEGVDYQVLKSINLNKYRPNLICIEILDKKILKGIKIYLNKFEYYYIKRFSTSYLFEYKR